jgi:hypothetical protein
MYGREALRQFRERQEQAAQQPERQPSLLDQVPSDAPMDDATVTVWNGERLVAYDRWLATAPIERPEAPAEAGSDNPAGAGCLAGVCGEVRVWLVQDGERWLMYVGSRKAKGRRRDFATPHLAHAIRTVEFWYGVPAAGWHAEKARNGKGAVGDEAADFPPQDSFDEGALRGHDHLDLGGR